MCKKWPLPCEIARCLKFLEQGKIADEDWILSKRNAANATNGQGLVLLRPLVRVCKALNNSFHSVQDRNFPIGRLAQPQIE